MFALFDCNNFYASCERVFKPKLTGKPIVVLSNNDGLIIAHFNEAQALVINKGVIIEIKDFFHKHNLNIISNKKKLFEYMIHC